MIAAVLITLIIGIIVGMLAALAWFGWYLTKNGGIWG